jgi:hypothetical protein
MGVNSSKGFNFRLMASGSNGYTQLDTFQDEQILVSDNVTGLFDLGVLPSDFTRQIQIPGTKTNNAFFEHVYDIAVENPYLFSTNVKVPAYFDFDGIYISQGYLQLNAVNVYANKFVESYEISIYGGLSSFGRDINRFYLTDLTSSLSQYDHTASYENISASWNGDLFDGDIVYPMAEYGQKIIYSPEENQFGIDSPTGGLAVQDFKPSIRVKKVWDAIFQEFGYTYSSSFFDQPWLDNVYLLCNNKLKYPIVADYDLETYGLFKISPISGSGTDVIMNEGSDLLLEWYNIQSNPSEAMNSNLQYQLSFPSQLRGELNLEFEVSASGAGNGMPQFYLDIQTTTGTLVSTTELQNYNSYMGDVLIYNSPTTKTEKFELLTQFNTELLPAGNYKFYLRYEVLEDNNFVVILNPDNSTKSYLSVTKVNQGGDYSIMEIAPNMPFGTSGIKLIDFITSIQKKFNLVIYPNKTKSREFIVETFNNWYDKGETKDFNKYINLDEKIVVTPANNLAVNELQFGDKLDGDYVSQQFSKANNREYGKTYYIDTENFFSQGQFKVETSLASSPIIYLNGTGVSGSAVQGGFGFSATAIARTEFTSAAIAQTQIKWGTETIVDAYAQVFTPNTQNIDNDPNFGYTSRTIAEGQTIQFVFVGTGQSSLYDFIVIRDGITTYLDSGTDNATFNYVITSADVAATVCYFEAQGTSGEI